MAGKPDSARGKRARTTPRTEPGQRGEPPLSLERIVATAVDLLDAHGVDGLTMRRLATRLESGAMSLYWHVANKEEVFDLALDAVLAVRAPQSVAEAQDWREEIFQLLEDWRATMLRHPWSAALLPRRALGPNILARLERLGRILAGAGVAEAELNVAIWSLWNYVIGATVTRASFERSGDEQAAAQQRLAGLETSYPTIEGSRLLLDSDWDGTFRRGLAFLLDGLPVRQVHL